jgi:type II secretory pathway pseudopilin PulG
MRETMKIGHTKIRNRCRTQAGISLLETLIAVSVLLIASVGILSMGVVAMTTSENQGHRASRTAEYAQDKAEQLLSLAYGDGDSGIASDTTVFPTAPSGGTGLILGGSSDPDAPVAGYVDYVDANGNLLGGAAAAGWFYKRVWQVSAPAGTTNLKQITVTAVTAGVIGTGQAPRSTITALKTSPF